MRLAAFVVHGLGRAGCVSARLGWRYGCRWIGGWKAGLSPPYATSSDRSAAELRLDGLARKALELQLERDCVGFLGRDALHHEARKRCQGPSALKAFDSLAIKRPLTNQGPIL